MNKLSLFRKYADTHDRIPPDRILAMELSTAEGTIIRNRNKLKAEGYGLIFAEAGYRGKKKDYDGAWIVTNRPEAVTVPEPPQAVEPQLPEQPVLLPVIAHTDSTLEDLLRELISVTRRAWGILD